MEEDMVIQVFEAHEIDLDYEFDAARYFDFTHPESLATARGAELWFDFANSYPPSPFVAKLALRENVSTSPKSNVVESSASLRDNESYVGATIDTTGDCIAKGGGISTDLWNDKLQKFHNQARNLMTGLKYHMTSNDLNGKIKPDVKRNNFPRSSTLMKPTASQLAKQNQSYQGGASRFEMPFGQSNNKNSCNSSGAEVQAAKRQKLDGGHLPKHLADVKHQTSLVHKVTRKDGPLDGNFTHGRLKLTIPREPDLETAQRAQRARPNNRTEEEEVKSVARKFKARPLNRKILEAPSLPLPKKSTPRLPEFQVFHLKTLERAMQHTAAHSSSLPHWNHSEKGLGPADKASSVAENTNRRPNTMNDPKQNACDIMHNFKAQPLNKKEFNFHSHKRIQHNPPVDLFSKLSLTPGLQPNKQSQFKLPHPSCKKGPKENRFQSFQQEHKMTHLVKDKCSMIGIKQQIQTRVVPI